MHLTPRELDKLVLHGAGALAQKRLARGLRLSYPEAVALIATQLLELIREGRGVAELMDVGRQMLGHRQVMEGVGELIDEVQVEGTFPDGTKLVTVHHPIVREDGDLELALYGSFLPVPPLERFAAEHVIPVPGAIETIGDAIELNAGTEDGRDRRRAPRRSTDPGRQPLPLRRGQQRARVRPGCDDAACVSTSRRERRCASSRASRARCSSCEMAGAAA